MLKTILQINTVVNSGSTGRIAEDIGKLAIEKGWQSYIASGRNICASSSNLIPIGNSLDMIFHGLQTRLFDNHGFNSTKATTKLIGQIKKISPNIIHLHNLHGYYINIEILFNYLKSSKIPIIWTFHDCWPITGHCVHFDFIGCDKWKTRCSKCPQKNTYPSGLLVDRSIKNYRLKRELFSSLKNLTIVTVSNWLEDVVHQSFLSSIPIRTISNGVNIEIFTPRNGNATRSKYGIGDCFVLLGVASNWGLRKGLNDFYKLSKVIDSNMKIVLVGLSKKQMIGLPKNIIGIAKTENTEELTKIYSSADIVLNLSYEETFGLTTVEGFACGTPGIVYDCTASPELVSKETGIIVEKGNISELVIAINEIQLKGKDSYSVACLERARKYYDKNEKFMEYVELYDSILNK